MDAGETGRCGTLLLSHITPFPFQNNSECGSISFHLLILFVFVIYKDEECNNIVT
jgi:hypothetical protein